MNERTPPRLEELLGTVPGFDPDDELDRAVIAQSDIYKELGWDLFKASETHHSLGLEDPQELPSAA